MSTTVDFDAFHQDLVRDHERRRLAAPHVRELGPLAFSIEDGRAYTFAPAGDMVDIRPGTADAATIVGLSATDWAAFVTERFTRYGVLYNAAPRFDAGGFADLCRWEPALRTYLPQAAIVDGSWFPPAVERAV